MASKASQREGSDNPDRDSRNMTRVLGAISAFIAFTLVVQLAGVIFSKDIAIGVKLVSVGITGLGIGFVVGFMAAQKCGWISQRP